MELTIDDEKMKKSVKEAIIEIITEKKDLFYEIILEAIEDIALAKAITEGRKDELVTKDEVLAILEAKPSLETGP